jgi:hypothetical protein
VAKRSAPPPTEAEISHGVPLFLDQLCEELRRGPSKTHDISKSAMEHGHDLLLQKFVARDGDSHRLEHMTDAAITAFEVLRTGNVGVGGSTGAVVHRNLMAIRAALLNRPSVKIAASSDVDARRIGVESTSGGTSLS